MAVTQQQAAQKIIDTYWPKIEALLGVSGVAKPIISFTNLAPGQSAAASNGMIQIDSSWSPKDIGTLIHEMTHVAEPAATDTHWAEGLADAVRYILDPKKGATGEPGWVPNKYAQAFIDQYQSNPGSLVVAGQALANGTFKQSALTGGQYTQVATAGADTHPAATLNPVGAANADAAAGTVGGVPPIPPVPTAQTVGPQGFKLMITNLGLPIDPELQRLVDHAVANGWSKSAFQYQLYKSDTFTKAFPGIFNQDGSLKMSPSSYISQLNSYQSYAAQAGVNLSTQQAGFLFQNNVSPAEFSVRAQAEQSLNTNKDMFAAFGKELQRLGLAPQGGLSRSDLFKFVMGEGNAQWYKVWQDASSRYAGQQAGIHFGNAQQGYTNIGKGQAEKIASKGLSASQMSTDYAALAKDLTTTLPMSRIQKMGLSKQDLIELEFGGSRQASVANKVQQILANEKQWAQGQTTSAGGIGSSTQTHAGQIQKFAQSPG